VLTSGGKERERPESWPAANRGGRRRGFKGGGTLELLRRREAVERVGLDGLELLVGSVRPGDASNRRIGDGPHRPAAALGLGAPAGGGARLPAAHGWAKGG
jgi:hypothetical protein